MKRINGVEIVQDIIEPESQAEILGKTSDIKLACDHFWQKRGIKHAAMPFMNFCKERNFRPAGAVGSARQAHDPSTRAGDGSPVKTSSRCAEQQKTVELRD